MADPRGAIDAPPGRPQVFFILAADESLEVDPPDHIVRPHEVQSRKRNRDGGRPAAFRQTSFRGPYPVPPGIAVARARVCALLFRNQRVALCPQRINLEYVRVPPVVSRVDDDFKVVIQFLTDVPAQLGRNDPTWIGVETGDTEVDLVLVVENADFGVFSRRLSF